MGFAADSAFAPVAIPISLPAEKQHAAEIRRSFAKVNAQYQIDKARSHLRMGDRAQGNADPSEATTDVLEHQLQCFVPLRTDELAHVIRVDTLQPNPQRAAFATLQAREVNLGVRQVAWPQRRDLLTSLAASRANPASRRH